MVRRPRGEKTVDGKVGDARGFRIFNGGQRGPPIFSVYENRIQERVDEQ